MKTIMPISGPVLVLVLMLASVAAAEPSTKVVGQLVQQRQQEDELDFATQNKEMEKCLKLCGEKKYDDSFERLTHNVVDPLRLREESNKAGKAEIQLQKAIEMQKIILRKRGKELLAQAWEKFKAGDDQETIRLAGEAKSAPTKLSAEESKNLRQEVKDVFKDLSMEADPLISKAQSRIRSQERLDQLSPEKVDPDLKAKQREIKKALATAANLLKSKKYDEAREQIEKVYLLEPGNPEAANLASKLYYEYYKYGYLRSKADVQSMMAYEYWQWVEPTFPRNSGSNDVPDGIIKTTVDQGIQSKLDKIIFPRVSFNETDIDGVIAFLRKNKNYDLPDKEGVEISYDPGEASQTVAAPAQTAEPGAETAAPAADVHKKPSVNTSALQITLSANNVSLRQLLDYLCFLTDLSYTVQGNGVVFGAADAEMVSRSFQISPGTIALIDQHSDGGGASEAADSATSADSSAGSSTGSSSAKERFEDNSSDGELKAGATKKIDISQSKLKGFFGRYGITFPPQSSINYNKNRACIIMYNTDKNQQIMVDLLRELNEDKPMIQIEVKSIQITDKDMQELGFYWALGTMGSSGGGSEWSAGQGENTVQGAIMSMLRSGLSGVDSRLLGNLNIFPDLFGSFKPFGSDTAFNLSLTINALDRNNRSEMISAPKVLTSNNQKAYVFLGKAYYFPSDWDTLEIETEGGDGDSGYSLKITPPTPSFDESEKIGTSFTVTPTVLNDNYTIRLEIKPSIKIYSGQDSYAIAVTYQDKKAEEEAVTETYYVWKPVISTREIDSQVDVYDGETLVLGGLVNSQTQARLDKIPILGDLPLVGRLFQSHSEISERVNMLIFVTARLVNNAGLPIRRLNSTGGIPEVNR